MRLRLIAPLLIAAFVALPGCDRPRPIQARPALFVVRDADTTIWLFGTIHVLPANIRWETPPVAHAMAAADTLVTELPPRESERAGAAFTKIATGPNLPPIAARVPSDQRPALEAAATRANAPLKSLDRMKSWAAAALLETGVARSEGASVENGVEATIAKRFAARSHLGLEYAAEQFGLFDALPEPLQRHLLVKALAKDDYRRTLHEWSRGDIAALDAENRQLFAGYPELEQTLLVNRNRHWSQWIARRMRQPGRLFIAVGAGHLAGPRSVVAMLTANGFRVIRLQ